MQVNPARMAKSTDHSAYIIVHYFFRTITLIFPFSQSRAAVVLSLVSVDLHPKFFVSVVTFMCYTVHINCKSYDIGTQPSPFCEEMFNCYIKKWLSMQGSDVDQFSFIENTGEACENTKYRSRHSAYTNIVHTMFNEATVFHSGAARLPRAIAAQFRPSAPGRQRQPPYRSNCEAPWSWLRCALLIALG